MSNLKINIINLLKYSGFLSSKKEQPNYSFKGDFFSTHTETLRLIHNNSKILDLGCNDGQLSLLLKTQKNCHVTGVDSQLLRDDKNVDNFIVHDLDTGPPQVDYSKFDFIIMLDVIEHLNNPENFLKTLKEKLNNNTNIRIIFTTPNIAFFTVRLSLLFGNFNYAPKGILDFTHKRLFTYYSFSNIFLDLNYKISLKKGIPAPFPLVIKNNFLSKFLLNLNIILIKAHKKLFSFQMLFVVKIKKT